MLFWMEFLLMHDIRTNFSPDDNSEIWFRTSFTMNGKQKEKLNNGYPFRDDIFNFTVVYKSKKHFFEFPLLIDRNTVVDEMKKKLNIRRVFCLRWTKWKTLDSSSSGRRREKRRGGNFMTETIEVVPEKEEEIFLHSSTLNTMTLRNFCGETFHIGDIPRRSFILWIDKGAVLHQKTTRFLVNTL